VDTASSRQAADQQVAAVVAKVGGDYAIFDILENRFVVPFQKADH
jgi:hypothetical protein